MTRYRYSILISVLLVAAFLLPATVMAAPPGDSGGVGGGSGDKWRGGSSGDIACLTNGWLVRIKYDPPKATITEIIERDGPSCTPKAVFERSGIDVKCENPPKGANINSKQWEGCRLAKVVEGKVRYVNCTRGFLVWRFYGDGEQVSAWSQSFVPNRVPCAVENYVFPTPHPIDGSSAEAPGGIMPGDWRSTTSNYPGTPFRRGKMCSTNEFEDRAGLKKYFLDAVPGKGSGYLGEPDEERDGKGGYDYDFHLTAIQVRKAMWDAYIKHRDNLIRNGYPTSLASYDFNTKPGRTIKYYDGESKKPQITLDYGDGRPCSSPLDFAALTKSQTRNYGVCWIGVGQQYVLTSASSGGKKVTGYQLTAQPYLYTSDDRLWKGNTIPTSGEPDNAPRHGYSGYQDIIFDTLPAALPGFSGTRHEFKITSAGYWQLQTVYRGNPVNAFNNPMTRHEASRQATCHRGTGSVVEEDNIVPPPPPPDVGITRTSVDVAEDAYVAGKQLTWDVKVTRGSLFCRYMGKVGDCNGWDLTVKETTWGKRPPSTPGWKVCTASNRTDCGYLYSTEVSSSTRHPSHRNDTLTYHFNFYRATRPGERVKVGESQTAGTVHYKLCYAAASDTMMTIEIGWESTYGFAGGIKTVPIGGAGGTRRVCHDGAIRIRHDDGQLRVGGPYLAP